MSHFQNKRGYVLWHRKKLQEVPGTEEIARVSGSGVKCFGGERVTPGAIIVRQRGSVFLPGRNVGLGRDFTIFSLVSGKVQFERFHRKKYKISVYS